MPDTIPYHPLSPPDDPTLFFGREDVIAFLRQHLVGANNTEMLVILGRTGIGKTSVLQHIPYIVDERYQPVYMDVEALDSVYAYLSSLANRIVQRMELIGASTYRVPDFPPQETPDEELLEWFAGAFLDVVLAAISRSRFLLVMLDDFHRIFEAAASQRVPAHFVDYLGDLLKQHDRLSIVVGINVDYEDYAMRHTPTANLNYHFRLQHLKEKAARQLIVEPVTVKYECTEEAIVRILELCGGYPFLLHSICRLLYRHYKNNPQIPQIGVNIVDLVYTAALEETSEIMRDYWQHTTTAQQTTLMALLEFYQENRTQTVSFESLKQWMDDYGTGINGTQLAATLRSLEYDLLVETTASGDYRFATQLEADWLLANTDLKQRREEKSRRRARLIGLAAVAVVVVIVVMLLAVGVFDPSDDAATPNQDAPPTSTLPIDMNPTPN